MLDNEYIKIEEKLVEEYNLNREKIEKLDEEIELLQENSLENRNLISLLWTFITHIMFLIFLFYLQETLKIPTAMMKFLSSIIPVCSIGTGMMLELIQNQKNQDKLKLSNFSNIDTNREIIEEKVKCEIKREKLLARNTALKETLNMIRENQELMTRLSFSNTTRVVTNIDNFSIEELEKDLSLYNTHFLNNYKRLDDLITKKTIISTFALNKSEKEKVLKFFGSSIFLGLIPLMLYGSLNLLFDVQFNLPYLIPISILVSSIYNLKSIIDNQFVFSKINEGFKNKLPRKVEQLELEKINAEIQDIIINLSNNLSEFTKENILLEEKREIKLKEDKEKKKFTSNSNSNQVSNSDALSENVAILASKDDVEGPKLVYKR